MKRSETIVSSRLQQIKVASLCLMLLLIAWVGYLKFLYGNGYLLEKKNTVEITHPNTTMDMEKSFGVNLQGLRKVNMDTLIHSSKTDSSELSLIELLNNSCARTCIGEPAVYVRSDHGYVLYRESSGMNIVLEIKKNSEWIIENKRVNKGL
ncbi:hypothetical protein AALF16_09780 [Bacillus cereus]|uniref:hypothetical protein n=1 Tax=Bacillus cereus TaxID=1396 RepID=UPI00356D417A